MINALLVLSIMGGIYWLVQLIEENITCGAEYEKNSRDSFTYSECIELLLLSSGDCAVVTLQEPCPADIRIEFESLVDKSKKVKIKMSMIRVGSSTYVKINREELQSLVVDNKLFVTVYIIGVFSYEKIVSVADWPVIKI